MRRVLRGLALVAVVGCVLSFLSIVSGTSGSGSSTTGSRQAAWFLIGQPWPWYEYRMEQEIRPDGGQSGSGGGGVILKTPAWLLPVAALAGVLAIRWLRPAPPALTPA